MRKNVVKRTLLVTIVISIVGVAISTGLGNTAKPAMAANIQACAQSTGLSPNVYNPPPGICAGWYYDSHSHNPNYFVKKAESTWVHNLTNHASSYAIQLHASYTQGTTASGSLNAGWGPISASIGVNGSKSISTSYAETVTITIDPHYYGYVDMGTRGDYWSGTYYYMNSNGTASNSHTVTVYQPAHKMYVERTQHD